MNTNFIRCQLPSCRKEFVFDENKNKYDLFCSDECRAVFVDMEKLVRIKRRIQKEKEHKQKIINKKRRQRECDISYKQIKNKNDRAKYVRYYIWDKSKGCSTLTVTEFMTILDNAKCIYCGHDENIGLDRVDNSKGHTLDNVVTCCYLCNMTRNNYYTFEEFKLIGSAIKQIRRMRIKHTLT